MIMKRTITLVVVLISFASILIHFLRPVSRSEGEIDSVALIPNLLAKASGGPPSGPQDDSVEHALSKPCTNQTLSDAHGFSFNGTVFAFGAIAATGKIVFDGSGNISGSYAESLNGRIIQGHFVGSYTVNSDCTGSGTVRGPFPGSWSALVNFVIVNNTKETLLVGASPGAVVTGFTKRL